MVIEFDLAAGKRCPKTPEPNHDSSVRDMALNYVRIYSRRQLRSLKRAVAVKVLRVGLSSGRIFSIVDAFECLIDNPFARHQGMGFYSLSQFYLRFVKTDAERLDLLVWLQTEAAGCVMLDQIALRALLNQYTKEYTADIHQLAVVFQSVRLHRPIERVMLALDQTMRSVVLSD